MKRLSKRVAAFGALLVLIWLSILATQIVDAGRQGEIAAADAALVLGAAVYGDTPSPVFRERINHGIALYKSNKVKRIIFTGGYAPETTSAEALVARRYAMGRGVPDHAILTETVSRTTRQNIVQARRAMRANGLHSALVVSDPLHLKRALLMARDLGMDVRAAPTPTTRYRSWRSKAGFLMRELYFYNHYLITGQ